MRIETLKINFEGELLDTLYYFFNYDEQLTKFFAYVVQVYTEKLIWDNDALRRFNYWFFFNVNKAVEDTHWDDQEIVGFLTSLEEKGLVLIRDTHYDSTIQIKIDLDYLKSLYIINHKTAYNKDEDE